MENSKTATLPLRSLNHVSRVCKDVQNSAEFYRDVLGFVEIQRPDFNFEGSWLFNYNIGIHLIKGEPLERRCTINPKSDHLSFQSDSLAEVEKRLQFRGIQYVKDTVVEAGIRVSQIFFHDPDNNMIEICNCDCLPVIPLDMARPCTSSTASMSLPSSPRHRSRAISAEARCISPRAVHNAAQPMYSKVI